MNENVVQIRVQKLIEIKERTINKRVKSENVYLWNHHLKAIIPCLRF